MLKTKEIGVCAQCKEGKVLYTSNNTCTRSMRHCDSCKVNTWHGHSVITIEELKGFNKDK